MTTRTFKQYGYGISTTDQPVTITVTLDGQEIFNGAIPSDIESSADSELFTWEMPLDFAGTQLYELTVQNGSLHLGRTQCNYSVNDYNAPEDFGYCCIVQQNDNNFNECFSGVVVDGVQTDRVWEPLPPVPDRVNFGLGQWHWTIHETFSATLTVQTATHYE